jgi:hypothetical protein
MGETQRPAGSFKTGIKLQIIKYINVLSQINRSDELEEHWGRCLISLHRTRLRRRRLLEHE